MSFSRLTLVAALMTVATVSAPAVQARSAAEIAEQGHHALHQLEAREPVSRFYARHAVAVLVFPSIFKAGLLIGGESGNGVLFINGRQAGFYNLSGGTFGFQAGAEKFSYALFFMKIHLIKETLPSQALIRVKLPMNMRCECCCLSENLRCLLQLSCRQQSIRCT